MAGSRNFIILLAGVLLGGFWSIFLGKELNWDLANYHFYNPFAFLTERSAQDSWPMEFVHVHFTPTLDFLTYFLITTFSPKITTFLMGALHGINFFLLFLISHLMFQVLGENNKKFFFLALFLAFLGMYGPTVLTGIGSFQHDNLINLFVLTFVLLQLKSLIAYSITPKKAFFYQALGCLILGIGIGGKLTAALYAGALFMSFLFLKQKRKQKMISLLIICFATFMGVLLSSGYWMASLWEQYQNPFFPLWNGIFKSSHFPFFNWQDNRFMPEGIGQILFYPFYFSWDGRTNDVPFRDFRFAIVYILFAALAFIKLKNLFNRSRAHEHRYPPESSHPHKSSHPYKICHPSVSWDPGLLAKPEPLTLFPTTWLFLFFIFAYFIWQHYFSIMRYLSALEMLAPLVIYLLLHQIVSEKNLRFALALIIFFSILGSMQPAKVVRAKWYENDYFNVNLPSVVKNERKALVLMPIPAFAFKLKPRPQTYLIPSFPKEWQFVGVPFVGDFYQIETLPLTAFKDKKTIYLLASSEYLPALFTIAKELGYQKTLACEDITSDRQRITNEDVKLCRVAKVL